MLSRCPAGIGDKLHRAGVEADPIHPERAFNPGANCFNFRSKMDHHACASEVRDLYEWVGVFVFRHELFGEADHILCPRTRLRDRNNRLRFRG